MKTSSQILNDIKKEEREMEALMSKMNSIRERIQWLRIEYEAVKRKEAIQSRTPIKGLSARALQRRY